MYVPAGSYTQAAAILQSNLELGAFMKIVPFLCEKQPNKSEAYEEFKHIITI